MSPYRRSALAIGALLSVAVLVGCSTGSSTPPRASGSITQASRPARTSDPTTTAATTAAAATTTAAPTTTSEAPTTTAAATTTKSEPAPASTAGASDTGSSSDAWIWVLVIAAVLVLGGLIWLLVRNSGRRKWDGRLAADLTEARWMATTLTDSVASRTLSPDAVTLYWNESRPRVDALQAELATLPAGAPDDPRRTRAVRVGEGVRALAEALRSHVELRGVLPGAPGAQVSLEQSQSVVETRRRGLQDAIDDRPVAGQPYTPGPGPTGPPAPPGPTGPPPPPPPPGWSS